MSDLNRKDVHLAIPTAAWIAKEAGAEFECYLESERNGRLFARTGSTVLGGHHHQQFNYLNAVFDVKYIILGEASVFRSSIDVFGAEVIVETESLAEVYKKLLALAGMKAENAVFAPGSVIKASDKNLEIGPYIYPEILFRKALAFPVDNLMEAGEYIREEGISNIYSIYISEHEKKNLVKSFPGVEVIDSIKETDTYGTITVRIAERWKNSAKGLAFADPAAILSQLASLCRDARVSVYGEKSQVKQNEIILHDYTEAKSEICADVIRLAEEIGNRVIVGRQTGDGDLFEWAKGGVCIQIMDPNRPAFPIVGTIPQIWANKKTSLYDSEPDDETLLGYAREGKILATLMWHSGEMAHNEAMLNLLELSSITGIKMGIGVHAARYETCPQMWELINIPREKGGVQGLIEPVIHSGGMGIMAEVNCPPDLLRQHCKTALERIRRLAGDGAVPKGYYAFADTDLETLTYSNDEIYKAVEDCGLEYFISSVRPGRNLIIYESEKLIAINQTVRTQCFGSPFVRVTTVEDFKESAFRIKPGWIIGTLDAPVISFNPYIWRHGSRFMEIVDWMLNTPGIINVTPHTIARYARILRQQNILPMYRK